MSVIGSFKFPGPDVTPASPLPSWTCYLDGNVVLSNNISAGLLNKNNVEICSLSGIVRAPEATFSNLTVVASSTTGSQFLFDRIQYEPDATVILDNATVVVDAFDSHIDYSSGWTTPGQLGWETSVQNSTLNFDFVGAFRLYLQIFPLKFLILCRYPIKMDDVTHIYLEHSEHHHKCLSPV